MSKILNGLEALEKLKNGAIKLSNCVKSTLGPKGKNTAIDKKYTTPLITNDGVTIAREIELDCPFENMGASIVKESAVRSNDQAGDGTTTACILTSAIIEEGFKNISAGANPILIRKGIEKTTKAVVEELKKLSKPIENQNEIIQVATISSGSETIGKIIGDAIEMVGTNGIITIEESNTSQTYITRNNGYEYDRGFASPYMITNPTKMQAELINPLILVVNKKINTLNELIPILEQVIQTGKHLLIIADDIDNEPLASLVLNRVNGNLPITLTKAPAFADKRKQILEDICTLTGSVLVSDELGTTLSNISLSDLGSAKSVIITKDKTTIIDGNGSQEKLNELKETIKEQLKNEVDSYTKDTLQTRLAKLSNGVAIINAGASSELEIKELKLRIEDALSATKSASEEGIVPGGGSTLLYISNKLKDFPKSLSFEEEQIGAKILLSALRSPIRQVAINSGYNPGEVEHIVSSKDDYTFGFDALNGEYKNLLESGIIDPTKVTRCALENSASVAATLLTTNTLITEEKENKE